jgi:hypothetical protein
MLVERYSLLLYRIARPGRLGRVNHQVVPDNSLRSTLEEGSKMEAETQGVN